MKDLLLKGLSVVLKNFVHVVAGVLLLIVFLLGYQVFEQHVQLNAAKNALIGQKDAYSQLSKTEAELSTNYLTEKDLRAKEEADWASQQKDLKGQLVAVTKTLATIHGGSVTRKVDPVHMSMGVYLSLTTNGVASAHDDWPPSPIVGVVAYESSNQSMTSWTYPAQIEIDNVATRTSDGRYHVLAKGSWISGDPHDLYFGKKYPLNITGGELDIDPSVFVSPKVMSHFTLAPHLSAGGFFAATTDQGFQEGIHGDLTVFGYGRTKNDLDFKFVGLGIDFNQKYADVSFVPVSYRVPFIPLISNLWVSPYVGATVKGRAIGLTLSGNL